MKPLLQVQNLKTYFHTQEGIIKAVDGVDFSIFSGKTLCIVGESGCGKSITSMSIMRLLPEKSAKIEEGQIFFKEKDLVTFSEEQMETIRGNQISMIFQEPVTSLNPVFSIGEQIIEVLISHQGLDYKRAYKKTIQLLKIVGIARAEKIIHEYPHQLSGGMCQRVMIAIALACRPKLLIADEPTTALDVTIQAQILDLMNQLKNELNMGIMLITHDLGIVAEMADYVIVMYAGKVVEEAPVEELFEHPRHPYTLGLLNSTPNLFSNRSRLECISGMMPNPLSLPTGCPFAPRCKYACKKCSTQKPRLKEISLDHKVRCFIVNKEV